MTEPLQDPTHPDDVALRARLADADPATDLPPAEPDEVDRLLQRVVTTDLRETGTRHRSRLTWLVAAAAVVVIAVAGTVWIRQVNRPSSGGDPLATGGPSSAAASTTRLTAAAAGGGRCMMPTPDLIAAEPIAFAGTVLGVADGVVTLTPTTVYAGRVGEQVTVTGAVAPDTGGADVGDPAFEAGRDYLVVADGDRVVGCGFSGPATPALQRLYDQAFPG